MRKLAMAIILSGLFLSTVAFGAGEWDIPGEARPTINKAKQGAVFIYPATKTIKVYRPFGYMDAGVFVMTGETKIIWRDIIDNPDTPEDETSNKFSEFMSHIDKAAIKAMIQAE